MIKLFHLDALTLVFLARGYSAGAGVKHFFRSSEAKSQVHSVALVSKWSFHFKLCISGVRTHLLALIAQVWCKQVRDAKNISLLRKQLKAKNNLNGTEIFLWVQYSARVH